MHDLFGAVVAEAGPFIVNVHTVVIVLGASEGDEIVLAEDRLYEARIDQIIAIVILKTTVFVILGFGAYSCLDRVTVDVADSGKELVVAVDRRTFERRLEEAADALVLSVVPVDKAGDDALENAPERGLAGLDDKMDVVGHQAVSEEFEAADGLIFAKRLQKPFEVFSVFENILFVDAAINDVINAEGTDFALGSWHRRDLFDLSFVVEMNFAVTCRQLIFRAVCAAL